MTGSAFVKIKMGPETVGLEMETMKIYRVSRGHSDKLIMASNFMVDDDGRLNFYDDERDCVAVFNAGQWIIVTDMTHENETAGKMPPFSGAHTQEMSDAARASAKENQEVLRALAKL